MTAKTVTLYHDIEQDIDSTADPETCRRIVRAFLEIEGRYGVPATYNVVGKLFREQPDLIDCITKAGQEVAFHSYHHQPTWQPAYYANEVALCRQVSNDPKGYRSPRSQWDDTTLVSAWDNGFLWNAEADRAGAPYFIHRGLVRLPIRADDWGLYTGACTPEAWVQQVRALLDGPAYFAVGAHDFVTSFEPTARLAAWEQVLQAVTTSGRSVVSFSAAAELFRRTALSEHYTAHAAAWNTSTRRLYRTRRFQEMIQAEADCLASPVVADLGSGGGVLTEGLKDRASVIYCIDESDGMLENVDSTGCVRPQRGEVTDSGLPDGSVDLIVCARVIEYLFEPDRLADEIRRIAKPGATYFVTFPARRPNTPTSDDNAPDRIRRYFTPQEIERWAALIGPGRLAPVQYDPAEPKDEAAERGYRAMELRAPPALYPTNWVYIGRVMSP